MLRTSITAIFAKAAIGLGVVFSPAHAQSGDTQTATAAAAQPDTGVATASPSNETTAATAPKPRHHRPHHHGHHGEHGHHGDHGHAHEPEGYGPVDTSDSGGAQDCGGPSGQTTDGPVDTNQTGGAADQQNCREAH